MKTSIKLFAVFIMMSVAFTLTTPKAHAQVSVSLQLFYDDLSPYGQWVDYPSYGNVWIPSIGAGFTPYSTAGHWVLTEFGWTWVSDYPWGWAPFHYGRWNYDPYVGWLWIPGREWAPAWVSWRRAPGYYGWVPLGSGRDYDRDDNRWVFVKDGDIDRNDIDRYSLDRSKNSNIMRQSAVVDNKRSDKGRNVSYNAGPDINDVRKSTGKDIKPVALRDNDKPGQKVENGEVRLYRPEVRDDNSNGRKAAPSKVVSYDQVKSNRANNPDNRNNQNGDRNQNDNLNTRPPQERPADNQGHPDNRPNQDNNNDNGNRPRDANPQNDHPAQPQHDNSNDHMDQQPRDNQQVAPKQDGNVQPKQPEMQKQNNNVAPAKPTAADRKAKRRDHRPK